jgi:predicted transcriptional regulator of viral defense system
MCTEKQNVSQKRFVQIARLGEVIFHASDLANLWGIREPNTLYTTLKRYVKSGLIFRIQKGMYSLIPVDELDPILLGIKTVHKYAYISTETVLFREGIINQKPESITIVSSLSMKFKISNSFYISRQLNERYLFNSEGIMKQGRVLTASVERAAADLLYFNPKTYFDAAKLINWKRVKEIQKNVGYKIKEEIQHGFTK